MFSDPSGLAPEGEKNNKVQAPGDDAIAGSISRGRWVESTHKVWKGKMSIVNPLDPSTHKIYEDEFVWEWVEVSSGGAGGGGGGLNSSYSPTETWGPDKAVGSSSRRKFINPNSLRAKSVVDQDAVSVNSRVNVEPQQKMLNRLVSDIQAEFNIQNHQLSQYNPHPQNYVELQEQRFFTNYIEPIPSTLNDAISASGGVVFVIENAPLLTNSFSMVITRLGINLTTAGIAINGFMAVNSLMNGDMIMAASYSTDGLMGVVGTTSIPGFAVATLYFGVQYYYPGSHDSGWVDLNNDVSQFMYNRNTAIVKSLLKGTYNKKLNGFK